MPENPERYTVEELRREFNIFRRNGRDYANTGGMRRSFTTQASKQVTGDLKLGWCSRCAYPDYSDSMQKIVGGRSVCSSCVYAYSACALCARWSRTGYMYNSLDSESGVCPDCINNRHNFCGTCDGYYAKANRSEHTHGAGSCCASPELRFQIRNNGDTLLANDTKTTVSLPEGLISDEGLAVIKGHVRNQSYYVQDWEEQRKWSSLAITLDALGNQWQTKDGNYAKRLSRHAYKSQGLKVPPKLMTLVGTVARDHSTAVDFRLEVTRQLNQSAARFGHAESCLWQSYSQGRCALKTNGAFGIRTFNSGSRVSGRAWVMPMRLDATEGFRPTFNTKTPDAYVIFNGYGDLSGYAPARLLSQMTGTTYRKIEFYCNPIYVNSEAGYLVGAEEVVAPLTDGRISLSVMQHSDLFTRETRELVNV